MDTLASPTYLTNLSGAEWRLLEPLLPTPRTGRPPRHSVRTIVNAILYVLRTGCAWRLLPADWPPWQTVYYHLRRWRLAGTGLGLQICRFAERDLGPSGLFRDHHHAFSA